MSLILNIQRLCGYTTFMEHVSEYVYVHLMRDLSLSETLRAKESLGKTDGTFQANYQALLR